MKPTSYHHIWISLYKVNTIHFHLFGYFRKHYSSPTGLCQHYNGNCSALLNSTQPRYINSSLGLNETDKVANALLDAVTRIYSKKTKDKRCKPILEKTVCFFVFPFCSPQETKLDYCREDCNHLFEICGADLNQVC